MYVYIFCVYECYAVRVYTNQVMVQPSFRATILYSRLYSCFFFPQVAGDGRAEEEERGWVGHRLHLIAERPSDAPRGYQVALIACDAALDSLDLQPWAHKAMAIDLRLATEGGVHEGEAHVERQGLARLLGAS